MSISPSLALEVHREVPFNAEPKLVDLRASFITPAQHFYVRCHGEVPVVAGEDFRLMVDGLVTRPLCLSLRELEELFEPAEITATLQCAGNRRSDLHAIAPVSGDLWGAGAIGTATWSGVRLVDLLLEAGIEEDRARHIAFEGLDVVDSSEGIAPFGASIPIDKALGSEVLLATRMNGHALLPAHGAPLRLVVPGYAGVRSVKWLKRISVSTEPSQNHHQQLEYKLFPPEVEEGDADWSSAPVIDELPLNSAICFPAEGERVSAGSLTVRGYAIAGERGVSRVDVSADGGQSFTQAAIESSTCDEASPFTWTFWSVDVKLPAGKHEIVVRAVDTAGQSQPSKAAEIWNFKGYLAAAWHRITIEAV